MFRYVKGRRKFMPEELIKFIIQQDFETSNSGVALKILGVAPKAGEKGVALKEGEITTSHLTPLHAASEMSSQGGKKLVFEMPVT